MYLPKSEQVVAVLAILLWITGCADSGNSDVPRVDPADLEKVEDLSESLANDLLDLSVATRQQNRRKIGTYFQDQMDAIPLPADPGPAHNEVKWIGKRTWETASSSSAMSREQFLDNWDQFFSNFQDIEDVRFKVKGATFETEHSGHAKVYFYVIGRNRDAHREWVKAWAQVDAVYSTDRDSDEETDEDAAAAGAEGRWQIGNFQLTSLESTIATDDLFSEVSKPAGVALELPSYGTPGNEGFVWHGAATADIDRDGDVDIFVTGNDRNYLYLNAGDGTFEEGAESAGVHRLLETGVASLFVDYDNDGDQDLFVTAVGKQVLLRNQLEETGRLSFFDVSVEANVSESAIGFSATAGDVNGDGFPDVFVASYNRYGVIMPNGWHDASNGTPNLLFISQGDGTFRESAHEWNLTDTRWSYAAQFVDIDADRDLDLYVANDFGTNGFFRNEGGRFVDVAGDLGISDPGNGMGVSFGDYNNDGRLDLHITNMSSTAGNRILGRLYPGTDTNGDVLRKLAAGNSLYEQLEDGSWKNVTRDVGGFGAGWAWGGGFLDFDNDCFADLYTPNGFVSGKSMKDT